MPLKRASGFARCGKLMRFRPFIVSADGDTPGVGRHERLGVVLAGKDWLSVRALLGGLCAGVCAPVDSERMQSNA
jgi:hypothetical protein